MPFLESHGRKIYYERHGSGPAVLFCHGAGSNAATWWQQLPVFSSRYTCITMDARCFGRSIAPVDEFSLPLFVDDALAVLDQEAIEQTVVVGQSLGGMIALRLTLQHPDRITALVACDSPLAIDHPELLDTVRRRLQATRALRIEQRSFGRWFVQTQAERLALYAQINHFNPSWHSIADDDWNAAVGALLQPPNLIPLADLRQIGCPTMLLVGDEDPMVPVSVMQEVSRLLATSEVAVIPQAGHSAYFEQPAEFNRRVLDFIGRHSGRGNSSPDRSR